MGRVQNAFYFVGTFLQIALSVTVGFVAERVSLAGGFAIIGCVYLFLSLNQITTERASLPDTVEACARHGVLDPLWRHKLGPDGRGDCATDSSEAALVKLASSATWTK
jgi:hypothetical protein